MKRLLFLTLLLLLVTALCSCDGNSGSSVSLNLDDTIEVTGISLDQSKATIDPNSSVQLQATVTPDDATTKTVVWESSDEAVATVNADGLVSAKTNGETIITATSADGNYSAICTVTVRPHITVSFDSQGGSNVSDQSLDYGSLVTRPSDPARSGYTFNGWYKETTCSNLWNFTSDTVTADMTLYAGWTGPITITGLSKSDTIIVLKWSNPAVDNLDHIRIICSDGTSDNPATSPYTLSGLTASTTYRISVFAVDTNGYESEQVLQITTESGSSLIDYTPVSTRTELEAINDSDTARAGNYVLTTDIDLSGNNWTTIGYLTGSHPFTGNFEGAGHVISNISIDNDSAGAATQGLFGYSSGTIQNVGVAGGSVSCSIYSYVGGLLGYNSGGTIRNCYATCSVSGDGSIGGLVGCNSGTITDCYATGSADGNSSVGGLVGSNSATVTDCYATGSVSCDGSIGGLIGSNSSTVTDCFYNTQTTGQTTSEGGTGITTTDMQSVATFTDTSSTDLTTAWDFAGDPNNDNGTEDIWSIDTTGTINSGYPYLTGMEP